MIIGLYTPPFNLIHDEATIQTLDELGVVFLMFSLGLEFSLRKLFRVGATAFVAALSEIVLMIWIGYEIGRWFDWSVMDSLFLGAMLAISSTTIIVKALSELDMKGENFAQIVFGILIVEDILAIAMLVLLSGIAQTGSVKVGVAAITLGKLLLLMMVSLGVRHSDRPERARLRGALGTRRDAARHRARLLLLSAGREARLFDRTRRVPDRRDHDGVEESRTHRAFHRASARHVFGDLFRQHRPALLLDPTVLMQYAWPIAVVIVAVVVGNIVSCGLGIFPRGARTAARRCASA